MITQLKLNLVNLGVTIINHIATAKFTIDFVIYTSDRENLEERCLILLLVVGNIQETIFYP